MWPSRKPTYTCGGQLATSINPWLITTSIAASHSTFHSFSALVSIPRPSSPFFSSHFCPHFIHLLSPIFLDCLIQKYICCGIHWFLLYVFFLQKSFVFSFLGYIHPFSALRSLPFLFLLNLFELRITLVLLLGKVV